MIVSALLLVLGTIVVPSIQLGDGYPQNIAANGNKNGEEECLWNTLKEELKFPNFLPRKMFIEDVLQGNPKKLFTAPRGFGKSTNLKMLQYFLTNPNFTKIEIPNGQTQTSYAVLYINLFAHEAITTHQKVYDLLREKIHLSYLEHSYLLKSERLNTREKEICEKWSSLRFVEMTNHSVALGWIHLCGFVSKHWHPCEVVLLIDEYDSVIINALYSTTDEEFKHILFLLNGQMSKLLKYNDFVDKSVIVGESFMVGSELSGSNDIEIFRFLDHHSMANYFGFSDAEIHQLLLESGLDNKKEEVFRWYGGYYSKHGQKVNNPFSVNKFLEQKEIQNYWRQKGNVRSILKFFQVSYIRESFKQLLRYECAPFSFIEHVNTEDLLMLKSFIANIPGAEHHQNIHDIFFTFLFDQGYFAWARNDSSCITIPNTEVDQVLTATLTQHYVNKHVLNPHLLKRCAQFIDKVYALSSNVEISGLMGVNHTANNSCLKLAMDGFFNSLEDVFKDYKTLNGDSISDKDVLTEVMFVITNYAPTFVVKSKLKTDYLDEDGVTKKAELDLYLYKGSFVAIFELTHTKGRSPSSIAALQTILDRQYYKEFNNSIYTPNEVDHFLFVGLSTNNKGIPSVSCLLDSKNITEAITVRKFQKRVVRNISGRPSRRPRTTRQTTISTVLPLVEKRKENKEE